MTVAVASARAGIAKSTLERIESGSPSAGLANIVAAAEAVGLDFVCQLYPGTRSTLRDAGQMAIAEEIIATLHRSWSATFEATAGAHGEAVDLMLRRPEECVAVEIERKVLDWQAQLRRASLKRDWLAQRTDRPVRLVIVATDSRRNRAALAPYANAVAASFPKGSRSVHHAFRQGQALGGDGLCWVRTRADAGRRAG